MKYDLVFEGGGAKGMVLVGAYEEFVRRGHTHGRLLGTSAGAITAALVAAGYTPAEMLAALNEREQDKPIFSTFLGQPSPFTAAEIRSSTIRTLLHNTNLKLVPNFIEDRLDDAVAQMLAQGRRSAHLFAFIERGGWYAADSFITWLQAKLDSGSWQGRPRQFSQMTLSEFFDATKVELSLVASDTTEGRLLVLNHSTAPACPLVWAIRMSMSIPLVWDEVIWQADWGTYLGRDLTSHAIVDGGLLSNFPLELFISNEPQVIALMGAKHNDPVLGLLIDESLPVSSAEPELPVDTHPKRAELPTVERILRLVNTATTAHDKMVIDAFNHLVVRLPAQGYSTTEFDMSDARRTALLAAGRDAMRTYFDNPPPALVEERGVEDSAKLRAVPMANRIASRLLHRDAAAVPKRKN
jgi:predicted acylesterase/phospholipase RssA